MNPSKITFRCTEDFKKAVDTIAGSEARSISSYIKALILKDMKERQSKEEA